MKKRAFPSLHSFFIITTFVCRLMGSEISPDEIFQDGRYFKNRIKIENTRQIGGYSSYTGSNGSGVVFRSYEITGTDSPIAMIIEGFRKDMIDISYREKRISGEVKDEPNAITIAFESDEGNSVILRAIEFKRGASYRVDLIFCQIMNH